jgi:hypothetical protein
LRGVSLAGVDLVALRVDLEQKLLIGWGLELLWDLCRNPGGKSGASDGKHGGECKTANELAHGPTPFYAKLFQQPGI